LSQFFKKEWPYLLGMGGGMLFFSLQTLVILILKLLFYDSKPFEFAPFVGIGFFLGAVLATLKSSLFLFKLAPLISFLGLVTCGIGLSYFSSYTAIILYSCVVMVPFGYLLTAGFFLLDAKKFYKYELFGSFLGLIIVSYLINFLSLETIIVLFLITITLTSSFIFHDRLILRLISILFFIFSTSFFLWQLNNKKFNLITYVNDISLPSSEHDNWKNGFDVLKNNSGLLMGSRWGLGERIDAIEIKETNEVYLYYNNSLWSGVYPADYKGTGIFPYFPKTKSYLDIGTGGAQVLKQALNWGIEDVRGLEINKALYSLMTNELRDYSGDIFNHVELMEGRKYLESSSRTYDLISIIKKSDIPIFWPTNLNVDYLGSKEGIKAIQKRLTPNGYIVWDSNIRLRSKDFLAHKFFSTLDAARFENESNDDLLKRSLVFSRRRERNYDPSRRDILIVLKKTKIEEEEYENFLNLMSARGYRLIFGNLGLSYESLINDEINDFGKAFEEAYAGWDKQHHELFSDKAPYEDFKEPLLIKVLNTIKWYLIIGVCVFSVIYLKKVKLVREEKNKIISISFLTGIYYGSLQIFLIQKLESAFSIPMLSFIVVVTMMLWGSATCTFLNKSFLKNKLLLFIHPLLVFLLLVIAPGYEASNAYLKLTIFICIFMIAFSVSVPFVSLLSNLNNYEQSSKSIIYLTNTFGFSIGMFLPLILNIVWGIDETAKIIAVSSLMIPIMNYFIQRGYSVRTLEKISSTAFR
jgi:hypothetical protein